MTDLSGLTIDELAQLVRDALNNSPVFGMEIFQDGSDALSELVRRFSAVETERDFQAEKHRYWHKRADEYRSTYDLIPFTLVDEEKRNET